MRALIIAVRVVLGFVLLLGVLAAVVFYGVNTGTGRDVLVRAAQFGGVEITGLQGHVPDDLAAQRITVADSRGVWLEIDDLKLQWQPTGLWRRQINASLLSATRLHIARYPASSGDSSSSSSIDIPYRVMVDKIHAGQVDLPEGNFALDGGLVYGQGNVDVSLKATLPDLAGQGPVDLAAHLAGPLNAAALNATLAAHGLTIQADGTANLDAPSGDLHLALDHPAIAGASAQHLDARIAGDATAATLHGVITTLHLPGERPDLLGAGPVTVDAAYQAKTEPGLTASLAADNATLSVEGKVPSDKLDLSYHLVLPKLEAFSTDTKGDADLAGRVEGSVDDLATTANLRARLDVGDIASTISGDIDAQGLPNAPVGHAKLTGAYGGEKVALDVSAVLGDDHQPHLTIAIAQFHGVSAKGAFALAADGGLPTGTLDLMADHLPAPATRGSAKASLNLSRAGTVPLLELSAEMSNAAIQGVGIARATLSGHVTDPAGNAPSLTASLAADGVTAGAYREAIRLDANGPANALALKLAATGTAALNAVATLNTAASQLSLSSLQGTVQRQTLRLAAPTTLTYAPQISLGPTKLALGGSTLDVAGQISPTLNLTAALRAVPSELAAIYDPTLHASGTLQADARVQGTTAQPSGTVSLHGAGLRLREYPGLPALALDATGTLQGSRAQTSGTLTAGSNAVQWSGTLPIAAGEAYDMSAHGHANLALLDPLLASQGILLRGVLALDGSVTGTEPRPSGTLTLQQGSVTIPAQGVRLADIRAAIRATPESVLLESLTARAGTGTISAHGNAGLAAPMPIDVSLTASKASPISSDLLNTILDANLHLSGALQTAMNAGGTIRLGRTEINLPQHQPADLPNLQLRRTGKPPPPPAPPVEVALDIELLAPDQIFVRGSGLDAELGGRLHIGGTSSHPTPDGGFKLRRGQYSLAGQNLNFTTGLVSFDGHLPIDPTLDFEASSSTSTVTATLAITGTASKPAIKLSAVPELPQDEVLAQLLFHRSASELTPVQLAQIAAGLAQLADIGGAGSFDPLGSVRKKLGLDVLSVGGSGGNSNVEAGRNIAKGVYVGAKQSTSGTGSQATLRLDLAKGLRLEADLGVAPTAAATPVPGAPPTGNQVGIVYEFEY